MQVITLTHPLQVLCTPYHETVQKWLGIAKYEGKYMVPSCLGGSPLSTVNLDCANNNTLGKDQPIKK